MRRRAALSGVSRSWFLFFSIVLFGSLRRSNWNGHHSHTLGVVTVWRKSSEVGGRNQSLVRSGRSSSSPWKNPPGLGISTRVVWLWKSESLMLVFRTRFTVLLHKPLIIHGSAYGNRTRLSALRGPCPNR